MVPGLILAAAAAAAAVPVFRRLTWLLSGPTCDYSTSRMPLPSDAEFTGKVCWVTGASSGIGLEIARALAERGAKLILTARREQVLQEVARSLGCPAENVSLLPADLAALSSDQLKDLAEKACNLFGPRTLHYLFNNAGLSMRATVVDMDMRNVDELTRVNYIAPITLTRCCLQVLRENWGAVLVTSSLSGIVPTPLRSAYAASKIAVTRWHDCLRYEEQLCEPPVGVVNVYPGSVRTDISQNSFSGPVGQKFGVTDSNIASGVDPTVAAEHFLRLAVARPDTAWIARGRELFAAYVGTFLPSFWRVLSKRVAVKYQRNILSAKKD